jgi:hypothetical protein
MRGCKAHLFGAVLQRWLVLISTRRHTVPSAGVLTRVSSILVTSKKAVAKKVTGIAERTLNGAHTPYAYKVYPDWTSRVTNPSYSVYRTRHVLIVCISSSRGVGPLGA